MRIVMPPVQWLHGHAVVVQGGSETDSEFWVWSANLLGVSFSGALYSPFGVRLKLLAPGPLRWEFVA